MVIIEAIECFHELKKLLPTTFHIFHSKQLLELRILQNLRSELFLVDFPVLVQVHIIKNLAQATKESEILRKRNERKCK